MKIPIPNVAQQPITTLGVGLVKYRSGTFDHFSKCIDRHTHIGRVGDQILSPKSSGKSKPKAVASRPESLALLS